MSTKRCHEDGIDDETFQDCMSDDGYLENKMHLLKDSILGEDIMEKKLVGLVNKLSILEKSVHGRGVTFQKLEETEGQIAGLTPDVLDLKSERDSLKLETAALKSVLVQKDSEICILLDKVSGLQGRSMRYNILLRNIIEKPGENCESVLSSFWPKNCLYHLITSNRSVLKECTGWGEIGG